MADRCFHHHARACDKCSQSKKSPEQVLQEVRDFCERQIETESTAAYSLGRLHTSQRVLGIIDGTD